MLKSPSCLLLAVAADGLDRHLFSSPLLQRWLEFGVVHGHMRAILPANGCGDVSLHLLWSETAWSPGDLLALQRCRSAIPASEPVSDCSAASSDGVATRESICAVSRGAWRVLEEDLMLLFRRELLHAGLSAGAAKGARLRGIDVCIEISECARAKRPHARDSRRQKQERPCMSTGGLRLHMLCALLLSTLFITEHEGTAD